MSVVTLYGLTVLVYALIPIVAALLSDPLRLILLYVFVAVGLMFGGFVGSVYSFQLAEGVVISGGNIAYSAVMMTMVLTVVIERDAAVLRRMVLLVLVVNVFKFLLYGVVAASLSAEAVVNPYSTSEMIFRGSTWFLVIGGSLIVVETLLIMVASEAVRRRFTGVIVTAFLHVLIYAAVIALDGVAFPAFAIGLNLEAATVIAGGIGSKIVLAVSFGGLLFAFFLTHGLWRGFDRGGSVRLKEVFLSPADTLRNELLSIERDLEKSADQVIRQATMIDAVGDGVFATDSKGTIDFWNAAAEQITGVLATSAIGVRATEIFGPERRDMPHFPFDDLQYAGLPWRGRCRAQTLASDSALFDLTVTKLSSNDGNMAGAIGAFRDITALVEGRLEIERSRDQIRSLTNHIQDAIEAERRKLARELHDELGQILTAIKLDLSVIESSELGDDERKSRVRAASDLASDGLNAAHRIVSQLRPHVLDELGMGAAVEWLVQDFVAHTGAAGIARVADDLPELPSSLESAVFRICQEAITNVAKHSGATQLVVSLAVRLNMLELSVRDNGCGIAPDRARATDSFGLLGIRERVTQLGGEVKVSGETNVGTTLVVKIPVIDRDVTAPSSA